MLQESQRNKLYKRMNRYNDNNLDDLKINYSLQKPVLNKSNTNNRNNNKGSVEKKRFTYNYLDDEY